jgi:hypothetical protein
MDNFDIGFIPEGWKRGDGVRVIDTDNGGRVEHSPNLAFTSAEELAHAKDMNEHTESVDFAVEDRFRVVNWLQWWNNGKAA